MTVGTSGAPHPALAHAKALFDAETLSDPEELTALLGDTQLSQAVGESKLVDPHVVPASQPVQLAPPPVLQSASMGGGTETP